LDATSSTTPVARDGELANDFFISGSICDFRGYQTN
jgi:hypothetical protein